MLFATARIAYRAKAVFLCGALNIIFKLAVIAGRINRHIGNGSQKRNVKKPLMGFAVLAYYSRAVYKQSYGKTAYCYIVYDLVKAAL